MKEFAWAGTAIVAVFVCAAISRAWSWWRSVPSFSHLSYDLPPIEGSLTDEEEAVWAEIEARLKAEDAQDGGGSHG